MIFQRVNEKDSKFFNVPWNLIVLRDIPEYTKNDLCICVDGIKNDGSLMLSHTSQMLCSYRMLYIRQAVIDAKYLSLRVGWWAHANISTGIVN